MYMYTAHNLSHSDSSVGVSSGSRVRVLPLSGSSGSGLGRLNCGLSVWWHRWSSWGGERGWGHVHTCGLVVQEREVKEAEGREDIL